METSYRLIHEDQNMRKIYTQFISGVLGDKLKESCLNDKRETVEFII